MDTIRWLHLSDIHYNLDNYESEWLRDNLIETLKSQNGKFDFLVITGDLLYQFNSSFDEVKTFLMSIINTISIPLENVFMILGNHDFERNKKREIFIRGIKSDKEKIKDMVADLDDDMINILINGQKEFWEFYEDLLGRKDNYSDVHFVNLRNKFNIINLNTCLISGTEDEEGTLSINMKKLVKVLKSIEDNNKPNIAIGHHSLECFVPEEQDEIVNLFEDFKIDIYLCGHIHQNKYRIYTQGNRYIPSIVCGSNMLDSYATASFVIGEVNLDTYECNVTYHKWSKNKMWVIDNEVDRKVSDNTLTFTLDRLKKSKIDEGIIVENNKLRTKDMMSLKKQIDEIKNMPEGKSSLEAINKYNQLLNFNIRDISKVDQFEIAINVLSIYVNLHDVKHVEEYIENINNLEFKDEKRLSKILSVYYFNTRQFNVVEELLNKYEFTVGDSLEYVIKLSTKCINGRITYDEFKKILLDSDNKLIESINKNDRVNLYCIISYVAENEKEYDDLVEFNKKALEIDNSSKCKLNLACAYYNYAIKDSIEDEMISNNTLYYEELIEAKKLTEEVIEAAKSNKDSNLYDYSINLLVSILSLLGFVDKVIDTLQNIGFEHKTEKLRETQDILEYIYKDKEFDKLGNLTEADVLLKDINNLIKEEKWSEILGRLEEAIWNKYKRNIRFHCILLEAYIKTDKLNKFIDHLKKVEILGIESNLLLKIKYDYYYKIDDIENAEECLLESIKRYTDPLAYYDLLIMYDKKNYDNKFEKLVERIIRKDKFVLEILYKEVYNIFFDWLFKKNMYLDARKILKQCDKKKYGISNYINKSSTIYMNIGDYRAAIDEFKEGYKLTNATNYLYGLAYSYMKCNELELAEEALDKLLASDFRNKEIIYAMLSNIEVLNRNLDKALEYCEKARELVEDFPKSDIHSFYVARCLRCNDVNLGIKHMYEFIDSYPKINDWVKPIKALERDENGNEKLAKEMNEFINKDSEAFQKTLEMLKSGQIGFVNIAKYRGQMYDEVFDWKDIYDIKVNINEGDIEELKKEYAINSKNIVIDAIGLYVISSIGILNSLKKIRNIYITYSTIEYLNLMLLHRENERIREIFNFISSNLNIKIAPINYKLYDQFKNNSKNVIYEFVLDSLCYAKNNNIAYFYGEVILKRIANSYKIPSIGILSILNNVDIEIRSNIIGNLKLNNYRFINFNFKEMYYYAKTNNFDISKLRKSFFEIDNGGSIFTFANQYISFLYAIYKNDRENFDGMYKLFIECMNRVYKKSTYYNVISKSVSNDKLFDYGENMLNSNSIFDIKICPVYAIQSTYYFFDSENELSYYLKIISEIAVTDLFNRSMQPISVLQENSGKLKQRLNESIKEIK